jgi:hypothetical protein
MGWQARRLPNRRAVAVFALVAASTVLSAYPKNAVGVQGSSALAAASLDDTGQGISAAAIGVGLNQSNQGVGSAFGKTLPASPAIWVSTAAWGFAALWVSTAVWGMKALRFSTAPATIAGQRGNDAGAHSMNRGQK